MALIPWTEKNRGDAAGLMPVEGLRSEMDRLFHSFFGESFGELGRPFGFDWSVPLDVEETDKEILVRAEIPGVKADELELSMSGNALVISGEKKESEEHKERGYHYRERRFGSFRREVPLPSAVDPDKVEAEYKDGVLHVRLHKAQEALPKKITVKGA